MRKQKRSYVIIIAVFFAVTILGISFWTPVISAQDPMIPNWIKDTALWWGEGRISDNDFINALQWLMTNKILIIPEPESDGEAMPDKEINFDKISLEVTGVQELLKVSGIRQALIDSNEEFGKMEDVDSVIKQRDNEWTSTQWEDLTPFMNELIQNEISDKLREHANAYKESFDYEMYPEIFVTNAYGVNIAQTGKTSDYKQSDELWWMRAKQDGLYISAVHYDESADVYSADIAMRINDNLGEFLGVVKAVTNVDQIYKPFE